AQRRGDRGRLVFYVHGAARRRGVKDRVTDHGGAIAILERRAVGSDLAIVDNRIQQVIDLVDEGMFPADDMSLGPPVLPPRVKRLADQHIGKALRFAWAAVLPE